MLKKLILIIISCFLIACSSTDNQTKYIDRKAPREKEVVETVQNQEENSSYNSVFEDVAIQVVSDMLDLGLKLLISTEVPVN
ncbi:hypothetical protein CBG60_00665 [Fusobacterium animalis]|uniref:Uncharacterized protein n=1 Tax=Fusobacterium animalis 7_1 TaxID=457405 RepID=A0A140PVX2_9FUSO|nr:MULTISPECIES: hypothetical protein [Fusobacterium]ASG29930.1 hypothetical protein CBG60_00665 [Fusobacterium animalis]EEO42774.1 hypothetical protein FSDG_01333 [Fusobacterium animalis 7_1]EPC07723.1 hypothetical protein HMPREF9369_02534 [Fusobacterium polymorphum F0401]ERT41828.1 hypothetical protein HMPREF1538_00765 [Fusobacterium nucleatum CTI-1]